MKNKVSLALVAILLLIGTFYSFVVFCVGVIEQPPESQPVMGNEYKDDNYIQTSWWKAKLEDYNEIITEVTTEVTTTTTTSINTTKPTTTTTTKESISTTPPTTTTTKKTTTTTTTEATTNPPNPSSEKLLVMVNGSTVEYDAYELICRIVMVEMGSSFPTEALKAQAVAAYTYVKYFNSNGQAAGVSISKNTVIPSNIASAVRSVLGEAIYYDGEYINATYFASCYKSTTSASDVWGGNLAYLVSVPSDEYLLYSRDVIKSKTFSRATMESRLEGYLKITLSNNPENWLEIKNTVSGGYVGTINVDDKTTTTGRRLRENILNKEIRSAKFEVNYNASSEEFEFTTYGYGHGAGMSQVGAMYYAKHKGYSYKQILSHYYTGVTIK